MPSKVVGITNPLGLHARPATLFVQCAQSFKSEVLVRNVSRGGDFSNAKSIMQVLAQDVKRGEEIEIEAEGIDANEAVDALTKLIEEL